MVRKSLFVLLVVILLATVPVVVATNAPPSAYRITTIKGDLDNNFGRGVEDALIIADIAAGSINVTYGSLIFCKADINGDNRISIIDALFLLQGKAKGVCSSYSGDVNKDGVIDISDVRYIAELSVGLHNPRNRRTMCLADLDKNNYVNILDALLLARRIRHLNDISLGGC